MPFTDPPPSQYSKAGEYYLDYIGDLVTSPPDPDWSTYGYYITRPENLSADDTIGEAGNCSWEWTFSAKDVEGNPLMRSADFVHPLRSWWRLRCGDTVIGAGPFTGINVKLGEEVIHCAGKTWEEYLSRWQYPFDPRPDHVNDYRYSSSFVGNERPGHTFDVAGTGADTPTGLAYQCSNRDLALIARDLLVMTRDGVPDRLNINFADLEDPIGITSNHQLSLGDSSSMDSIITTLAGIGEGFDWWITWDRQMKIGSPNRFGSALSPDIVWFIDADSDGLLSLEYENSGIQGNHVLGNGAGLAVQTTLARAYGYALSQDTFSRLDVNYDYGDVRNATQLENLTKKSLSLIINPIRTVTFVADPALVTDFWSTVRKGKAIYFTVDLGFHVLDAPYKIRSWELGDEENTGNMQVTIMTDRIYPQVADFGNPAL